MKRTKKVPTDAEKLLMFKNLKAPEVRFLVSNYYMSQEMRKRADMQKRHLPQGGGTPPTMSLLDLTADGFAEIEKRNAEGLLNYASSTRVGLWCMSNRGIGPVITAGLLAHIDITKAPTAGHIWSFAGLNPEMVWEKGGKRPYNADLKQLTYHLGECIKRTTSVSSLYGDLYKSRKALLEQRNEAGYYAERAKTFFTKSDDVKKTLKKGMLPAGNLDRQACNFVAKIFLSHLHAVLYWDHYKKPPPRPFAMAILGHAHEIRIPNTEEFFPGFAEAYYGSSSGDEALQAAE